MILDLAEFGSRYIKEIADRVVQMEKHLHMPPAQYAYDDNGSPYASPQPDLAARGRKRSHTAFTENGFPGPYAPVQPFSISGEWRADAPDLDPPLKKFAADTSSSQASQSNVLPPFWAQDVSTLQETHKVADPEPTEFSWDERAVNV